MLTNKIHLKNFNYVLKHQKMKMMFQTRVFVRNTIILMKIHIPCIQTTPHERTYTIIEENKNHSSDPEPTNHWSQFTRQWESLASSHGSAYHGKKTIREPPRGPRQTASDLSDTLDVVAK